MVEFERWTWQWVVSGIVLFILYELAKFHLIAVYKDRITPRFADWYSKRNSRRALERAKSIIEWEVRMQKMATDPRHLALFAEGAAFRQRRLILSTLSMVAVLLVLFMAEELNESGRIGIPKIYVALSFLIISTEGMRIIMTYSDLWRNDFENFIDRPRQHRDEVIARLRSLLEKAGLDEEGVASELSHLPALLDSADAAAAVPE